MKRIFLILLIFIILFSFARVLPEEKLSDKVKIGVSDDTSGFVVDYMISNKEIGADENLEAYFIKDC